MPIWLADDLAMNITIRAALMLLCTASVPALGANSGIPYWADGAKGLVSATDGVTSGVSIYAPNHKALIKFENNELRLYVNGSPKTDLTNLIWSIYLVEIKWSRDSKAVFINTSDGGLIGTWSTFIYEIGEHGVSLTHLKKSLKYTNGMRTNCNVNTASIAWLNGHRQLLILQQVPNSSSCANMGNSMGYILDVKSHRIVKELRPNEVKLHYMKYLGVQARLAVSD